MAAAGIAWRRPFGLQGCSPVYSVILHLVEVSVNSTVILRGGTGIARGALLGGSAGAWAGMYLFHHKTKHWYFVVGMPLILAAQLAAGVWLAGNSGLV
mgnify:CR=1 FL=1